jgi:nicotinamidase-related amidase
MKLAYGKQIPTTLQDLVEPKATALIVVDVQYEFATRDGKLLFPEMVDNLRHVIEQARRVGVLVVYIQDTLLPGRFSDSPAWVRHYMAAEKTQDPHAISVEAVDGTPGHQIIDDVRPLAGELVIKKHRSSAFVGTPLDLLLRSNGIRNVIATGLVTYGCVESTCRDASNEYCVVVLSDCVGAAKRDLHEAALAIMAQRYDLVTSRQVLDVWSECAASVPATARR